MGFLRLLPGLALAIFVWQGAAAYAAETDGTETKTEKPRLL